MYKNLYNITQFLMKNYFKRKFDDQEVIISLDKLLNYIETMHKSNL